MSYTSGLAAEDAARAALRADGWTIVRPYRSQASQGLEGYVAESRQRDTTWLVVNEATERPQVTSQIPLGERREIREADVWQNIVANLSRQPIKASAIDFIKHASGLHRGTVSAVQRGNEPGDRRERAGQGQTVVHHHCDRLGLERAPGGAVAINLSLAGQEH